MAKEKRRGVDGPVPSPGLYDNPGGHRESSIVDCTLSRTMKSLEEERKNQVRLSKRNKVRFRKNTLWNKSQKNGKVTCIKP